MLSELLIHPVLAMPFVLELEIFMNRLLIKPPEFSVLVEKLRESQHLLPVQLQLLLKESVASWLISEVDYLLLFLKDIYSLFARAT